MVAPKTYPPANRCIYCPALVVTWKELTREHIIPEQIGGRLKLPKASCLDHQTITSRLETECERQFFYGIRRHLWFGDKKAIRSEIAWLSGSRYEGILREEHPAVLALYAFMPPLILSGLPRILGMPQAYLVPRFLHEDVQERTKAHAHKPIVLGRDLDEVTLARFLAKIAHSFTAAELGSLGFKPFLIDLICGDAPRDSSYYVGGASTELPPPATKLPPAGTELHEIGFADPPEPAPGANSNMIVVRIRLFSTLGTPAYYVVAGEHYPSRTRTTGE